ncbi:hypothetical protein ALMP_58030 [Streptomyces sp. A012304]|nr:hypothetical protein ALMP_58030 [Streptomyces sp. A012304]
MGAGGAKATSCATTADRAGFFFPPGRKRHDNHHLERSINGPVIELSEHPEDSGKEFPEPS